MATIAERWHFDLRQLLAKDPGILGRAAKTMWVDRTPMKNRIDGVTNSTNPQEGGAMTRRDFLRLSGLGIAGTLSGELLAACARWTGQPTQVASATDSAPATSTVPAKPAVELGIQYSEVVVLDEASAVKEMANMGIPLDLAYAGAIKEFQDVKKYPQLNLDGARYDKFAIVVPVVGMDEKKTRYIYPFIGVDAVDPNSSFVAIMIPQYDKQGKLTGFAAESLEATEVVFAGAKRGALSVFRDPATGADISPRPVFIYPTDIAGWKQMTDAQRKAQAIIFIPYNLPSPKEIRISGGKLAKSVVDMATPIPTLEGLPAEALVLPDGIGEPMTQEQMRDILNSARRLKYSGGENIPLKIEDWGLLAPDDPDNGVLDIWTVIAKKPKENAAGFLYMDIILPVQNNEMNKLVLVTVNLGPNIPDSPIGGSFATNFKIPQSTVLTIYKLQDFLPLLKDGVGINIHIATSFSKQSEKYVLDKFNKAPWIVNRLKLILELGGKGKEIAKIISENENVGDNQVLGPIGPVGQITVGK